MNVRVRVRADCTEDRVRVDCLCTPRMKSFVVFHGRAGAISWIWQGKHGGRQGHKANEREAAHVMQKCLRSFDMMLLKKVAAVIAESRPQARVRE